MTKRREFSKAVKVEIVKRATREDERGNRHVHCEACDTPVARWEIHHTIPDAMAIDKSKPLTAADGELLCEPCHDKSTREKDVPAIAKAKRVEAKHLLVNPRLGTLAVSKAERKARQENQSADRRAGKLDVPPPRQIYV